MDAEIGKRRLLLFRHKCYVAATVDVDVINDASRAPARGYAAAAYAAHGVTVSQSWLQLIKLHRSKIEKRD